MTREAGQLDEDAVWARVCAFAERCRIENRAIWTLQERVANRIVRVTDTRVERDSARGRTNTAHIRRGEIHKIWRVLEQAGHTKTGYPHTFALALLQAALSDVVDHLGDGTIALRGRRPSWADARPTSFYAERAGPVGDGSAFGDFGLGEGEVHRRIKLYIRDHPDAALAKLAGGPWLSEGAELTLDVPTRDRIDVVVRDSDGRHVVIEVKREVGPKSLDLYAQAAKYRAIWSVLRSQPLDEVRCVLAAPSIPAKLARRMLDEHQIESVAVVVPADYEPRDGD